MTSSDRQPVRLRVYGILSVTRRGYVRLQRIGLGFCLILLASGLAVILTTKQWVPSRQAPPQGSIALWFVQQFLILLFWVGLVLLPLDVLEMVIMLRKFARAEALRHAQSAASSPAQPPTVPTAPSLQPPPGVQANTPSVQPP